MIHTISALLAARYTELEDNTEQEGSNTWGW